MKSFLIDTSSKHVCVAIYDENQLFYFYQEIEDEMSSRIFEIIDSVFKKAEMVPKEIDAIFIVTGPGSFTGIRIGVTIAKTMAYLLNKRIIPLSSLELMVSGCTNDAIGLIDARRGYSYGGIYDAKLDNIVADSYVMTSEIIKNRGIDVYSYDKYDFEVKEPIIDIVKVINKHKNDIGVNPHMIIPNYLKRVEAEEKRN